MRKATSAVELLHVDIEERAHGSDVREVDSARDLPMSALLYSTDPFPLAFDHVPVMARSTDNVT
jgi:hypothetical protein